MDVQIRFARAADGVDIAYAVFGSGPPLLVLRQYLSPDVHLELTEEPALRAPWHELAREHTILILDYRGQGLSGPALHQSIELGVRDIEAVAGHAGIARFDVFATMAPTQFAIAYAAAHPEQVDRIALWNPGLVGGSMRAVWADRGVPDIAATHFREYVELAALRTFGWDRPERARRMVETVLERYSAETWDQLNSSIEAIDASDQAASVTAPCLVIMDFNGPLAQMDARRQQQIRRLAGALPNAQLAIVKSGDTREYVERLAAFLRPEGPAETAAMGSGTAVILFADIVDSTALTERMGDAAFRERARALDESLRAIITAAGGTAIDGKLLGDGVLATFPAASQAIDAALRCGAAADDGGLPLHLGIHAGDVIREQNNVFGGAVNIASRISGLSAPGEVLVSDVVRALARTSAAVTFADRGEHALKGVGEPQRVYAVRASRSRDEGGG